MPSGFEAIQMISNSSFFNETIAPAFERIHLDHFPPLAYAPDTVGQMTAAGRTIYSKTLEEELAELDSVVSAWSEDSSYMVGFWQEADKYGSYNNRDDPKGIALASSSTFESIHSGNNENNEAPARIPHGFFDVELPDIPCGQDDFGDIEFQRSLLPIDTHQELLLAYADRI